MPPGGELEENASKLYIAGLPYQITEQRLRDMVAPYGEPASFVRVCSFFFFQIAARPTGFGSRIQERFRITRCEQGDLGVSA